MVTILPAQNTNFSGNGKKSLQKFLEPTRKPKVIYADNSLEFGKSCEKLSWNHCASTPHRSETNGIANRAVRRVKEGTSAVLLQSGLVEKWRADSMECYCYMRNIEDLLSDGKTPNEAVWSSIKCSSFPVWSDGRTSSCFCSRPVETASIRS